MADESKPAKSGLTYASSGVDIDAGNAFVEAIKPHIRRTGRTGVVGNIGGFGGLFDLAASGYDNPLLVAANDGVGTKLKLAFALDVHNTVGVDLVAMCVNDLVVQGAEPLFFLDYFATGKLRSGVAEKVVEGVADGCQQAGCALIGGETAEMPGMYEQDEYDLAGFAVGAVEREKLLPRNNLEQGDAILALASSGPHSNGFSLIRKLVETRGHDWSAAAPFVQSGQTLKAQTLNGQTLGEAMLAPTRIYVRPLLAAIKSTGAIKALAHITGGGMTENIPRVLPDNLCAKIDLQKASIDDEAARLFGWLASEGDIEQAEMLKTFNCGVGMILVVAEADADRVASALEENGETVRRIGRLIAREEGQPPVVYHGQPHFMSGRA